MAELSLEQAAGLAGVAVSTVHKWTDLGQLASRREGRKRLVDADALADHLREQGKDATATDIKLRTMIGAEFVPKLLMTDTLVFGVLYHLRGERGIADVAALETVLGIAVLVLTAADEVLAGPFSYVDYDGALGEIATAKHDGKLPELAAKWWPAAA